MNLFNKLLNLYRKSGTSSTPTEDYYTECLAGILRSNSGILNKFLKKVLNIETEDLLRVYTQRSYYTEDGEMGIVDLVFESESVICFLEMKVESGEGAGQLQKYQQILDERPETGRQCYLRYCSLYIDKKEGYNNFRQFRWEDIATFLENYTEENQLINEFYQFLKENKMAGNERFNHEDLIGLKVYGEIAEKVNEVFSLIEQGLGRFGTVNGGIVASKEITSQNRWALYCREVIGDRGSEVLVSFDFRGMRYQDEPVLAVQLFVNRKNEAYNNFVEVAQKYYQDKKHDSKDIFSTNEHGAHIRFEKPIAMFFSREAQLRAMADWVEGRLDQILDFRRTKSGLDWNFEI